MSYWNNRERFKFENLVGKVFIQITNECDNLVFTESDGTTYEMYHEPDCCERVTLEDVCGDFDNLLNSPIVLAEEVISGDEPPLGDPKWVDSYTWTFYKLATNKGYVTLRWYGESNGYYSESVSFYKIIKNGM